MSRSPQKSLNTDALIASCVQGDRKSQVVLFDTYKAKVHGIAWKMLGPKFDIDDVVQEVFINLFESLPTFKGLCTIDTWIYRLSLKICTDQLRRKYRKRQVEITSDGGEAQNFTPDDSPDAQVPLVERKEFHEQVRRALDRLSAEKKEVLVLFEMEGKSIEEISLILSKPTGTIKSRLFHGRNEMKQSLKRYMES